MTQPTPTRLQTILTALLLLITAWSVLRNVCWIPLADPQLDFRIYYDATRSALAGQNPYLDDNPADGIAGYAYPLFFMLLTIPLSSLPRELAENLWGLLNAATLLACCILLLRLLLRHFELPPRIRRNPLPFAVALALILTFKPVQETLRFGQSELLVLLALLAALNLRGQNRPALCGLLFAVAVLLKAQPLLLLPGFLAALGRRGLLAFSATLLAYTLLLLLSGLWTWEWYNWTIKAPLWTQKSSATTISLFKFLATQTTLAAPNAHRLALTLELALFLVYLAVLLLLHRRQAHWLFHAAWACAIVPPISRFMEIHHLTLLLIPALFIAARAWRAGRLAPILGSAAALLLINLGFTLQQLTNHYFQPAPLYYCAILLNSANFLHAALTRSQTAAQP